jgi:hypothetical protein
VITALSNTLCMRCSQAAKADEVVSVGGLGGWPGRVGSGRLEGTEDMGVVNQLSPASTPDEYASSPESTAPSRCPAPSTSTSFPHSLARFCIRLTTTGSVKFQLGNCQWPVPSNHQSQSIKQASPIEVWAKQPSRPGTGHTDYSGTYLPTSHTSHIFRGLFFTHSTLLSRPGSSCG